MTGPSNAEVRRGERRRQAKLRKWTGHRSGTLLGFCSVELASGMVINDLRLLTGKNGPWVAMPSQKQLDRDGNLRLDANGKPIFNQIVEFRDRATADEFNELVLALVRAAHPAALGD